MGVVLHSMGKRRARTGEEGGTPHAEKHGATQQEEGHGRPDNWRYGTPRAYTKTKPPGRRTRYPLLAPWGTYVDGRGRLLLRTALVQSRMGRGVARALRT